MIANFSVVPVDKGISLSPYVAQVLELVEKSGLNYHLHSMGTLIEGNWDEVMALIKRCHMQMRESTDRVLTNIQIDDRKSVVNGLENKRKSVEKVLGHSLR